MAACASAKSSRDKRTWMLCSRCGSRQSWLLARRAATGWAAGDLLAHNAGKQAAAIGAGAAVEGIGPMILLVCWAPYRQRLAGCAKVCGPLAHVLRHLAPVAVADPAEVATQIADHHLNIRALILVAHRVLPQRPWTIRKSRCASERGRSIACGIRAVGTIASCAAARWASGDAFAHNAGKEAATIDTGCAGETHQGGGRRDEWNTRPPSAGRPSTGVSGYHRAGATFCASFGYRCR